MATAEQVKEKFLTLVKGIVRKNILECREAERVQSYVEKVMEAKEYIVSKELSSLRLLLSWAQVLGDLADEAVQMLLKFLMIRSRIFPFPQ